MTFISAGHIILTPTQPVGSGRPQWESNPGPPDQELRALPTELPPPPPPRHVDCTQKSTAVGSYRIVVDSTLMLTQRPPPPPPPSFKKSGFCLRCLFGLFSLFSFFFGSSITFHVHVTNKINPVKWAQVKLMRKSSRHIILLSFVTWPSMRLTVTNPIIQWLVLVFLS